MIPITFAKQLDNGQINIYLESGDGLGFLNFEQFSWWLVAQSRLSATEDAERYRWLRNECSKGRRIEIAEYAEEGYLLDHYIDKGRVGL